VSQPTALACDNTDLRRVTQQPIKTDFKLALLFAAPSVFGGYDCIMKVKSGGTIG
jgi:hypothetical protein